MIIVVIIILIDKGNKTFRKRIGEICSVRETCDDGLSCSGGICLSDRQSKILLNDDCYLVYRLKCFNEDKLKYLYLEKGIFKLSDDPKIIDRYVRSSMNKYYYIYRDFDKIYITNQNGDILSYVKEQDFILDFEKIENIYSTRRMFPLFLDIIRVPSGNS